MIKKIKLTWFLAASLLMVGFSSLETQADERYHRIELLNQSSIRLRAHQSKTFSLDGWRHVKKLVISAEGVRNDAMFEILANDDVKGTIYVPGRDPEYTVTIGEAARNVRFKHISGSDVRVFSVVAYVSHEIHGSHDHGGSIGHGGRAAAANISRQFIRSIKEIEDYATAAEFSAYLLPIKVAAGRAYASAIASGDLSRRVQGRLVSLAHQVAYADPYIEELTSTESTFELAIELLTLKERLRELLD